MDVIADRYELREQIGAGAMATVWRGWDTRLHRFVAIKLLARAVGADPGLVARFEREARHAASLNHPNIVTIFDFGTERGVSYLVMELVEGESLAQLLHRVNRLDPTQTVVICAGVLSGLGEAHQHGIVHRDIKPSNILLGINGVKVADFGIARASSEATALTDTGILMGTVGYLSPEQCSGASATERSDLYAVGCLAYQCLAGAPPFSGETAASVMYQHQFAPPQPIAERGTNVPPSLGAAVDKALQKDPQLRFSSSSAMQRALFQSIDPRRPPTVMASPAFDPGRTSPVDGTSRLAAPPDNDAGRPRPRRRRRTTFVVAAVVVLIVAGVIGGLSVARHEDSNAIGRGTDSKQSGTKGPGAPPQTTPATVATSVPPTAPPQTRATLSVNECPSSYGGQQTPSSRIPSTIAVSLAAGEGKSLAFYSDSTRSVDPVLAPVGWSCTATVGADGSTVVSVFPSGESDPSSDDASLPPGTEGVIAYSPSACQDCVADLVCAVFPNAENDLSYFGQSCPSSAPPDERAAFLAGSSSSDFGTVELTDPPGVQGDVAMSGGNLQAVGMLRYSDDSGEGQAAMESCVLPSPSSALCSASVNDFVTRDWGFDS